MTEPGKSKRKFSLTHYLSGLVMGTSFFAMVTLPGLRGPYVTTYLFYYTVASLAYLIAVLNLKREQPSLKFIWSFGLIFHLILLMTSPSLSDDVYRYLWDGHLLKQGINPYALPVNAPELDAFDTSLRALVNHTWMASPYLPTAQLNFTLVSNLAPQSVLAFQISATIFSLLTAWIIMDLLGRLNLPRAGVLIYLWNPLAIVEFAHGAHIDALMIMLLMLAFWTLERGSMPAPRNRKPIRNDIYIFASASSLAAATLTKFLPALVVPLFLRRWGWKGTFFCAGVVLIGLSLFASGAGWGLTGGLDGTGVFGATRIYLRWWNFNGSLYHWLEVLFSGYQTAGAVPADIVGEQPILLSKGITAALLGLSLLLAGWIAWRKKCSPYGLLRLSMIPLGAYLLLTPTVHPWYLTLILPFLPFLMVRGAQGIRFDWIVWPWLYLTWAVGLSYLTYLNPDDFRELAWVRMVEYIPAYLLLAWSLIHQYTKRKKADPPTI